jgi:4-aminobutyrate aminotransferase-like enzyme/Ser/Thr protein kinase RdoA (MazF antagonist)
MLLEERVGQATTEAEAVRFALELYGLDVTAKALPGEYDDNFHLTARDAAKSLPTGDRTSVTSTGVPGALYGFALPISREDSTFAVAEATPPRVNGGASGAADGFGMPVAREGSAFVLKVMHPAREESLIDLQCRALQHLAQHARHLNLPRVCLTNKGEPFTTITAADGSSRLVWLLTFVPATVMANAKPHSAELLASLGTLLGEMDSALAIFSHPAAQRELKWDFARAGWIREYLHLIVDADRRALVEKFLALYDAEVVPVMGRLRRSVIYGDANDHNVLVEAGTTQGRGEALKRTPIADLGGDALKRAPTLNAPRRAVGVIDFGDMHESFTVSEVTIAAAYAILGKERPLRAAAAVVGGYHRAFPLTEVEISVLYVLIGVRLAVSVVNSAQRATVKPGDSYVTITEAPAWEALARLAQIHPRFAHYTFREACGLAPVPKSGAVRKWLTAHAGAAASLLDVTLRGTPGLVFDLSVGSTFLGADPAAANTEALSEKIFAELRKARVSVGIARYNEARLLYDTPIFGAGKHPTDERRTVHLGMDLFVAAGSAVYAPLEGVVHALANNTAEKDYGPVVILRHGPGEGHEFFTLYGHLTKESLGKLRVGQVVARGERIARVGAVQENGGWPPHLHFQVIVDLLDRGTEFPGVGYATERGVWTNLSPDPNMLLRLTGERLAVEEKDAAETLAAREKLLGRNLSVSYQRPLKIVRGWKQYLYDESGRAYLDVYNNVPLVGHSHPRVVRAAQEQLGLLNTNTRYLHDNVIRYAERLTELLPEPLRVCYFLNSGSEANELALRLARTHTGREDVIVLEHAYHGHTNALIDISPYKFDGPGGGGRKPWVHVAPIADDYRAAYRRGDPEAGAKYARHVGEIVERVRREGGEIAAFIAESLPSVAGQIVFPPNYLKEAYLYVRAAGGVCIADEVQVGFGRLGTHFWGFETQGVVPDIVVLGKPIGNAFPLAAVITTAKIAASFANGMEFFSTFGGNPAACAAGTAVLDVLRDERLQENAKSVGQHWMSRLQTSQERYTLIGDVRGSGLFLGIDLVNDRESRAPATEQAEYVVNRLRERGILAGTDGPHHNVIKLRPPLILTEADADLFVEVFDSVLQEDGAQPSAKTLLISAATSA